MPPLRITVPKTPRTAYDPQRKAGTLLCDQLHHLEWAVRPASARVDLKKSDQPLTEGEVAERIHELMARLHENTIGREPVAAAARTRAIKRPRPRVVRKRASTGRRSR